MEQLSNPVWSEIDRLTEEGEAYLDEDDREAEALACFQAAWDLLPEPKDQQEPADRLLAAIGDCYFFLGEWDACHRAYQCVARSDVTNPFARLRLGQTLFELGNPTEANNWMVPAYLQEGVALFAGEDPKYLAHVKRQLDPPEGSWPEGW
jgi:tetratricopeptide (TPR) repeat protein